MMHPDLEVVDVRRDESFKVWSHGYPYRTIRWHFHPEFELHLIVATRGKYFVGDHIGSFEPGHLVLLGPNLPHNWVSDMAEGETVERRNLVIQFDQSFVDRCMNAFPECRDAQTLLDEARRGVGFDEATSAAIAPLFDELLGARGMRRIALFMTILERLCAAAERTLLASPAYDQTHVTPTRLSHALSYIGKNLASDLRESDLAQLTGQSVSAFSRAFHRHTGMPFVQYVNRLRIEAACQMLLDERANITDICFQAGFNNVSNFNRQFRAVKGMAPSEFRALQRLNARSRELARHAAPTGNPMPPRVVTPGAPGFAAHPG
ncbi:AraC family transcriptional regulator [Burkholderia multivorans]|uniref:AraC family transcriptional regulator n=1 Tax=Burkholderia multivorans TaxID=87883 RepID=UPI0021BE4632|nr:AraC family transcriptional regulator [Burkholderia multivorans]